jgi:hypothetical protein
MLIPLPIEAAVVVVAVARLLSMLPGGRFRPVAVACKWMMLASTVFPALRAMVAT